MTETPSSEPARPRSRNGARKGNTGARLLLFIVVAVFVVAGAYYYEQSLHYVSTDDAYTDGRVATIAPSLSGYVAALDVQDNQRVKAGDILLELVSQDYVVTRDHAVAALALAEAQLGAAKSDLEIANATYPARLVSAKAERDSAQATLARAQADYKRQSAVDRRATTRAQIDAAATAERVAAMDLARKEADVRIASLVPQNIAGAEAKVQELAAQVALAKADLDHAEINLGYTKIVAPQDGWVTRRNVEVGNYVQPGQSLMAIVSPDVWVTANFKESQLEEMRPGQSVDIRLDAYPNLHLTGRVDSFQMGSGARFTAFPTENATGNFVKILQRIPVKIVITDGMSPDFPLALGLSAQPVVTIH